MGQSSAPQAAPVDTTERADPAGMGEFDRPGTQCLWHPFDAPHEGGADLDDALTLSEGVDL